MDLPFVGVPCMLVGCEQNWEWMLNYVVYRLVTFAKVYSGLRSLTLCSSFSISYCWKIYLKSDFQQFILIILLQVFSNSVVWYVFPYSCLLFNMCKA